MHFKEWLMNEVPIGDFELLGKWGENDPKYKYKKQDIGILTNPKAVEKIKKSWSNTEYDFDLYFVKSHQASKHVEIGEVTPQWVKENIGIDIQPKEDHITIIFTQNLATPYMPMTAWIIAHRISHAMRKEFQHEQYLRKEITKDFTELLKDVYGKSPDFYYNGYVGQETAMDLKALAQAVGTMKSARSGGLRDWYEFIHELVAQYIIQGEIKFRPLSRELVLRKRYAWGRENHQKAYSKLTDEELNDMNHYLQGLANKYTHYIQSVFGGMVDKIFVM